MVEAELVRVAVRGGAWEAEADGDTPLHSTRWMRRMEREGRYDQDSYCERALEALGRAGLRLVRGGAVTRGALQEVRYRVSAIRRTAPLIRDCGVDIGEGLFRMGVQRVCDLMRVDYGVAARACGRQLYIG